MIEDLLAHSAPRDDPARPQAYGEHVVNVRNGALRRAKSMLKYARPVPPSGLLESVEVAAVFHDLGKVGNQNQAALRKGRGTTLPVDHVDAGVAAALASGNEMAAWLIRAHHSPGLPSKPNEETNPLRTGGPPPHPPPPLRGKRRREWESPDERIEHRRLVSLTDANLARYLERHSAAVGEFSAGPSQPSHGLTMRLALSCLVDADHEDSARHDTLRDPLRAPDPCWAERTEALDRHVARLPSLDPIRDEQRRALYAACKAAAFNQPLISCQAAVGLGKTFAVTRYLLALSEQEKLRRLFIVAPFTNIISQTVSRLRDALVLPGEDPTQIVAEHHHRVDFASIDARDVATLWRAPIVVTTAVQFFETLASCDPTVLRKLHEVPGSAVFIDEAHAAIPPHLWPQNWRWLCALAEQWSCRFVLASGSLVRFWEKNEVINPCLTLPELTPEALVESSRDYDRGRVRSGRLADAALTRDQLVERVAGFVKGGGPVLVIMNTVQSAAAIARDLAAQVDGLQVHSCPSRLPLEHRHVLHLSTALCPRDRERILREIQRRQRTGRRDWILVATSCVEAGVELDFQTGLRERASVASFIQTSGRVNRHGRRTGARLYDFTLAIGDPLLAEHRAFSTARQVFDRLWPELRDGADTSVLATKAMAQEIAGRGGLTECLSNYEACANYPAVALGGRVIDGDTRTVIVDKRLLRLLEAGRRPSSRLIQKRSVQLWAWKIEDLGLAPARPGLDVYAWWDLYDPLFLGVMCGILKRLTPGGLVV